MHRHFGQKIRTETLLQVRQEASVHIHVKVKESLEEEQKDVHNWGEE